MFRCRGGDEADRPMAAAVGPWSFSHGDGGQWPRCRGDGPDVPVAVVMGPLTMHVAAGRMSCCLSCPTRCCAALCPSCCRSAPRWRSSSTRGRCWERGVPCRAVPSRAVPCRAVPSFALSSRAVPSGALRSRALSGRCCQRPPEPGLPASRPLPWLFPAPALPRGAPAARGGGTWAGGERVSQGFVLSVLGKCRAGGGAAPRAAAGAAPGESSSCVEMGRWELRAGGGQGRAPEPGQGQRKGKGEKCSSLSWEEKSPSFA